MQIRFWGTRGSIAKAGPGTVRYGGNTSCVELCSASGTRVVLDCGTGAHSLGQALMNSVGPSVDGHILIGHTHWDHIQGFPFFAPLRIPDNEWYVYGPRGAGATLRDTLAGQMEYSYFPVSLEQLDATVHYHDLVEGTFDVGDIQVTAQYLNHPALTLGYRLEGDGISVVYATDHEPHSRRLALGGEGPPVGEDERHARFLEDADLVIHDAQYTAEEYPAKTGWGHSTMEFVVDTARYAGARRLALFHHDPMRDDDSVDRLVSLARERATSTGGGVEVFAAAEGKVLELERPSKRGIRAGVGSEPAMTNVLSAVCAQSVLIASPDATAVSTLCDAVRADGLRLLLADDGDQALALVRAETPSLVVLDEAVLGRTALEVCRGIRELGDDAYRKDVAIVLMKAAEEPAAREEECAAGVTDWLLKPFDNVYARARVQAWLLRTACRWVRAPRPPDEERRMNSLQRLEILDTEPEERFDRYTRIASALFHMPIALVSLVDTNRQWFKSRIGLGATETPRDRAFCAHAILDDDVLQVRDAVQDSRFADNPLVIEEPRVRFYAGAPLKLTDGSRAGTLCLIDRRPRDLDERQLGLLRDLAMLVAGELERNAKP